MVNKIKSYATKDNLELLRDVRVLGLLVFLFIMLLISYSGVKVIESNYQLQKQIATLQQQNAVQQLQNNNAKLQNQYYNTNQYLDIAARQNFGLAAPGEKELIVPQAVALAHAPALPNLTASPVVTAKPVAHEPFYIRNPKAWLDFFFHHTAG